MSSRRRANALSPEPLSIPPGLTRALPSGSGAAQWWRACLVCKAQCCKRKRRENAVEYLSITGKELYVPPREDICGPQRMPAQSTLPEVAPALSSSPGLSLETCQPLHGALGSVHHSWMGEGEVPSGTPVLGLCNCSHSPPPPPSPHASFAPRCVLSIQIQSWLNAFHSSGGASNST